MKKKKKKIIFGGTFSLCVVLTWTILIVFGGCQEEESDAVIGGEDIIEKKGNEVTGSVSSINESQGEGNLAKDMKLTELTHLGTTIKIDDGKLTRSENKKDFQEVAEFEGEEGKLKPTTFLNIAIMQEDNGVKWIAKDDEIDIWSSKDEGKSWVLEEYVGGEGSSEHPYEIGNLRQFKNIAKNPKAHYILIENIIADSAKMFEPLPQFEGSLDGKNKLIEGIRIEKSQESAIGLFKSLVGAEVQNLKLRNLSIEGKSYVGSLAGKGKNSDLENVQVKSTKVKGISYIGGLVGNMEGGMVQNSGVEDGHVGADGEKIDFSKSAKYIGGLSGLVMGGELIKSHFKGKIEDINKSYVGGLAGFFSGGKIENSYAQVNMIGQSYIGGLIGQLEKSQVIHSYVKGVIKLVNKNGAGLLGKAINSTVTHCYFEGEVDSQGKVSRGQEDYVGGLISIGDQVKVDRSYVQGKVKGKVGAGFIGMIFSQSEVTNSYVIGDLRFTDLHGAGFVLSILDRSRVENSYSETKISMEKSYGAIYGFAHVAEGGGMIKNSYAITDMDKKIVARKKSGFIHNVINPSSIMNSYAREMEGVKFITNPGETVDNKSGYKTTGELEQLIKSEQIGPN